MAIYLFRLFQLSSAIMLNLVPGICKTALHCHELCAFLAEMKHNRVYRYYCWCAESDYMPQHTRQTETDGRETAPSPTSQQDTHSTMPTSSLPLHMSLSSGFTHSNTISEGETNTLVVLNSHSAVSTTSSGQWSAGLSKNVTSTKQHTKSPTSTKVRENFTSYNSYP